ncbi:MAG: ketoacyl-ACP synthase III [Desulfobacterales bacterium]|jgi:3-oxoacyl-[acyl-carrier-protein] synthase-3|nr:ketoacyl-ACP synthase III [Desulfobacterales bacterium]
MKRSIITRTGSYIPPERVPNTRFLGREFYDADGRRLQRPNPEIVKKLHEITGIEERRYAPPDVCTTDMAAIAAESALAGVDREGIDYIIVAHNFGDLKADNLRTDMVPTIAARVKQRLKIKNPYAVAFDLPFGCPGWLQGVITADYFIRSGDARKALVIGAETLVRVADPHDVDSMIYSDGAGAALLEATEEDAGILAHLTRSDTLDHAFLLRMGRSYNPGSSGGEIFVKMDGHDIYKYAVKTVPAVVKKNLDHAGLGLGDVAKILIHQANEKMDAAIVKRLFDLYKVKTIPADIMPMIISWTGNSSVATLPTLLDLILKGNMDGHRLHPGDIVVFASVGAGMNVNSMVYRVPSQPASHAVT